MERERELEHRHEHHKEQRDDQGELDERLPARADVVDVRPSAAATGWRTANREHAPETRHDVAVVPMLALRSSTRTPARAVRATTLTMPTLLNT